MVDRNNAFLVIGNGYDLHCNLESKFSDYFDKCCKATIEVFLNLFKSLPYESYVKRYLFNDDLNFWSLFFYQYFYTNDYSSSITPSDIKWFDVETAIQQALTSTCFGGLNSIQFVDDILLHLKQDDTGIRYLSGNPFRYLIFLQNIVCGSKEYLIKELAKFEKGFRIYIKKLVVKDYEESSNLFFDSLINQISANDINVLNFNYTIIPNERINKQVNIHGSVCEDEIIIGIDSNDLKFGKSQNTNNIETYYEFTKTFRNLCRIKQPLIFPKDINVIAFYGHSLSRSDFSYFYSLFDMYNLYDSNLRLSFLYSRHGKTEDEKEKNLMKYTNGIYDLLSLYSNKSHNENNLLHRLILEGRIELKEV